MSVTSENNVYVILINDDNSMTTTQKRRIVQRSKLIDNLWFLVKPEYNGFSMAEFTVLLEYLAPVSKKYRTEFLNLSENDYNGYLKYTMPIDTMFTAESGRVEFQITFLNTEIDGEGNSYQRVRKITDGCLVISPVTAWSDIIPDSALTALDQRIIKMDAQINAINEASEILNSVKADNIVYDNSKNELQLTSNGNPIGDRVVINQAESSLEDGVPVVDLGSLNQHPGSSEEEDDDIIEF